MTRPAIVAVLFLILSSIPVRAQPRLEDAPDFKGMRERWEPLLADFEVPGMAIAIVRDGKVHAIETFGVRSPDSSEAPTPDTMYYIASITKTYLATAICALADDGKLSLDDPVRKYLPRLKFAGSSGAKITIRDLLSHRPGINCFPVVLLDAYTGEISDDRFYKWLSSVSPRQQVEYSNVHFTILGRVIEAVSGKDWRDYLEERVFTPAGMKRTTGYASRMYADPNCAIPMERRNDTWRACSLRKTDRTMHAAGGLGASASDAARWLVLHLNDGEIDGTRVISADRAREMRTLTGALPQTEGSIRIMKGFGLGWQVGTFHDVPFCAHGGGYLGTTTSYAILPDQKAGFVILMNAGGAAGGLCDVIAIDILDRLLDGDKKVDVLDAYRKELPERLSRSHARLAREATDASELPALSRPLATYQGRYTHSDLGIITIGQSSDRLTVSLGDCRLDVAPGDVSDSIRVLGPTASGVVLTFSVTPDGEAQSINAVLPEVGQYTFVR
jgi:CubicO group peptidase (beta-lactamase class C family)